MTRPSIDIYRRIKKPVESFEITLEICTICNSSCIFCAYRTGILPKKIMRMDTFCKAVDKITEYYDNIKLISRVGENFLDPNILEKLEYLYNHNKIRRFQVWTNGFQIPKLVYHPKLSLFLSIYGHDEVSFTDITGSNRKTYQEFLKNFEYLINTNIDMTIGVRTYKNINITDINSELVDLIYKALLKKNITISYDLIFDNWNGLVKDKNLTKFKTGKIHHPGIGACDRLTMIVNYDGKVSACRCIDMKDEMIIGDILTDSVRDIIKNRDIIRKEQNNGLFRSPCDNCVIYASRK